MVLIDAALVLLGLSALVATWRVAVGPTAADRALGVDFGFAVLVAAVALLSVRLGEPVLLDLVVVFTLVGFLSTVAFARLAGSRSST